MGLEPDARLVVNGETDMRTLPLTPIDFFLFSRVEMLSSAKAAPTVADVIAASGQPSASAEQALVKLIELGVLVPKVPVPAPITDDDADRKRRARERKRGLLAAQMRMATGTAPRRAPGEATSAKLEGLDHGASEEPSLPTPRDGQRPAREQSSAQAASAMPHSILEQVEPVAQTDARLEPELAAVPLDRQRRLLALRDRLRHVGHFELLGLEPVDDTKAIRRAYHLISREFHPDSYFGKDLGSYRAVLDDLFRRARSSYEFLLDNNRRKALVDSHEAQVREERERHERADAAARTAAAEQARRAAEEARVQAEAQARAQHEQAQKDRAGRDLVRQQKLRERALGERRKQAAAHAEQARRERDVGRHGTAATLFRLAHEEDQGNPDYEREWRESLATARRQRAELNFGRGRESLQAGRLHEAARFLAEAAQADPSLRNLTEAAAVVAEIDPEQAHSFAMSALETLQQAQARAQKLDDRTVASVHQACARAFLAVGQLASAREQAERANQLAPTKQTRALLNSIKLT